MSCFSKHRLLLVILLIVWLNACISRSAGSAPTISAPTLTMSPLPKAIYVTATKQELKLTPTTTAVPTPDDKRITARIDMGSAPWTMAVGDGFICVIVGNSIVRIDPKIDQIVGKPIPISVPPEASPEAIAVGEGTLWVTIAGWGDLAAPSDIDSILRIDPHTGETMATTKTSRGPWSLAITPGIVWVANFGHGGITVSRIDAKANQIIGEGVLVGRAPISLAAGDGSIWVVSHDTGILTRIDPTTNQVIARIQLPSEPHRVAFGEGAVWVGYWHDNSVSRIDPKTNQIIGDPIPIGFTAGNIAAGDGNVWVTSDYRGTYTEDPRDVVLVRIDPKTNQVVDTIPLNGHPVDVKITENAVWVSFQNPNMILRINP